MEHANLDKPPLMSAFTTEIFLLLAMAIAKNVKCFRVTIFDLVTLVQTLQRLHTTTNSVTVVLRFTLSLLAVARGSKSSVAGFSFDCKIVFYSGMAWSRS